MNNDVLANTSLLTFLYVIRPYKIHPPSLYCKIFAMVNTAKKLFVNLWKYDLIKCLGLNFVRENIVLLFLSLLLIYMKHGVANSSIVANFLCCLKAVQSKIPLTRC